MALLDYLKNVYYRSIGVERDLLELIADKDISKAKMLFEDTQSIVEEAIKEYNPDSHAIMARKNKKRKNRQDYETEKLPRSWQEHINEVELFFLLNNPIIWTCSSDHDKEFALFKQFLKDTRFDSNMRKAKRMAGAETLAAKLYHMYEENGEPRVLVNVLSRQDGYVIRPLFNQYKQLIAGGVGYYLKDGSETKEYFDIHTPETIYRCKRDRAGWDVTPVNNPTGKINLLIYQQAKAWRGAQRRIERDEILDSKAADVNNYFADPMAAATADVIKNLADPESVGKLIQLTTSDSDFRYIEPPSSVALKESEKEYNKIAIQTDTFTPPFDFENMLGLGNLSGAALEKVFTIGLIKRNRNIEIYDEMLDREKNVILGCLKVLHPKENFEGIVIEHKFQSPFKDDLTKEQIMAANQHGLLSRETSMKLLDMVANVAEEIERIEAEEKAGVQSGVRAKHEGDAI